MQQQHIGRRLVFCWLKGVRTRESSHLRVIQRHQTVLECNRRTMVRTCLTSAALPNTHDKTIKHAAYPVIQDLTSNIASRDMIR